MDELVNKEILIEMVKTPMPFGKYKGCPICDLPEHYLTWFSQKGFPDGRLGMLMSTAFEVKLNGLDALIVKLKKIVNNSK